MKNKKTKITNQKNLDLFRQTTHRVEWLSYVLKREEERRKRAVEPLDNDYRSYYARKNKNTKIRRGSF